jgi:MFS family permease
VFSIAASFFFSAFASLLAAAIVDKFEDKVLLVVSAIFFVAFIIFLVFSLIERKEVYKTKKTLDLGRVEWHSQG